MDIENSFLSSGHWGKEVWSVSQCIPGFLNLASIDIWGQIIHCCEVRPVHCRISGNLSGFYPLDASGILPLLSLLW